MLHGIVNQQCVVYKFQCDLFDASYVGYTIRHLHRRADEHKNRSSSIGGTTVTYTICPVLFRKTFTNSFSSSRKARIRTQDCSSRQGNKSSVEINRKLYCLRLLCPISAVYWSAVHLYKFANRTVLPVRELHVSKESTISPIVFTWFLLHMKGCRVCSFSPYCSILLIRRNQILLVLKNQLNHFHFLKNRKLWPLPVLNQVDTLYQVTAC